MQTTKRRNRVGLTVFALYGAVMLAAHWGCRPLPGPDPAPGPVSVTAVIDGPVKVLAGNLTLWHVGKESVGDSFHWEVVPDIDFLTADGGRTVAFARRRPGTYTWILVAATKVGEVDIATLQFVNGEEGPDPPGPEPVPPVPPVPPGPDPPDPDVPFAALRDFVTKSYGEKVTTAWRVDAAHKLGASMKALSSAIAAGTLTDPQEIREETQRQNRVVLQDLKIADALELLWSRSVLAVELERLITAGKLTTKDHYAEAWRAIGDGLLNVK